MNASVGDADSLLQGAGALGRDLLVALVDVGFDHEADNSSLAFSNLLGDDAGHLGLVLVVLLRVAYMKSVLVWLSVRHCEVA